MCAAGRPSLDPRNPGDFRAGLRQELYRRLAVGLHPTGKLSPTAMTTYEGSFDLNSPALAQCVGAGNLRRYESALETLSVEYQQAIVARIELGFSYSQIAVCIGKSNAEDARATVCQAILHLAQRMSDEQR